MKFTILLFVLGVIMNDTYGAVPNCQNGNPYLVNNLGVNNLVGYPGPVRNAPTACMSANYVPNNCGCPVLTNDPIPNINRLANEVIANVLPNTIASASFFPNNLPSFEPTITNVQFTPVLSELMPSLQYGDITMAGELPIGGTIKVCGCIPVYGIVNVDGIVPSTGTAVVAESYGNQLTEVVTNCGNPYFS